MNLKIAMCMPRTNVRNVSHVFTAAEDVLPMPIILKAVSMMYMILAVSFRENG